MQRLIEVVAQVVKRFQANAQADEPVGNAVLPPGGRIVTGVRHQNGFSSQPLELELEVDWRMAKSDRGKAQPTYIPPPRTLRAFPNAYPVKGKTPLGKGKVRKRWKDPDSGDILEWDYLHGKLERYSPKGAHKGEFDPETGNQSKPASPDRTIMPAIVFPRK